MKMNKAMFMAESFITDIIHGFKSISFYAVSSAILFVVNLVLVFTVTSQIGMNMIDNTILFVLFLIVAGLFHSALALASVFFLYTIWDIKKEEKEHANAYKYIEDHFDENYRKVTLSCTPSIPHMFATAAQSVEVYVKFDGTFLKFEIRDKEGKKLNSATNNCYVEFIKSISIPLCEIKEYGLNKLYRKA